MFIFANLLSALAIILSYVLDIIMWLIIIRALLSWVNPDPYNPIVQFLYRTTDFILEPLRRAMPLGVRLGMIDITPMIAILIIIFLKNFLVQTLIDMAIRLK